MNHPWSFCFSHISHAIYHKIVLALLSKYIQNLTSFLHLHCYSLISPSSHTWNTGETFKEDSSFYLSSMNHSQHHHQNNPLKAPVRKVSLMRSALFHLEQSLPSSQMLTWPCMTANTPTSFPLYRISYYSFFPLSAPFTLAPLLMLKHGNPPGLCSTSFLCYTIQTLTCTPKQFPQKRSHYFWMFSIFTTTFIAAGHHIM